MKPIKHTEKYLRAILLPLVAFMLVFSTVLPSVALAADASIITVYPETITQDDINTKSSTIRFTLKSGHSWAEGIKTEDLIAGMTTSVDSAAWDAYKSKVSMAINNQTLTLTLPKAAYDIKADQTITMDLLTVQVKDGVKTETSVPVSFVIKHTETSILTINPTSVTEADIQAGNAEITLKLTDNEWKIDSETKRQDLIKALVAKDQKEQWEKVKQMLSIADTYGDTLTIKIPQIPEYKLSTNQTISLKAPCQLLEKCTSINEVELTIKAALKVLISGTATPKVSQADLVNGGKTIIVTAVNSKWDEAIVTNAVFREKLLAGFTFDATNKEIIQARANVVRTNDEVVTITLPPLTGFKIGEDTLIEFNRGSITATPAPDSGMQDAFTITPTTNQSAAVSGSIVGANEFDIAEGGKEIIVTLKNDSWTTDIKKLDAFQPKFVDADDNPVNLSVKKVERTSDIALTLTLQEVSDFTLTDDISVKLTIPEELLASSGSSITTAAFKITTVKAELPSGKDLALDKADIQKGGKTISITLKNATFKEDLKIDEAFVDSIFATSNPIVTALKNNLTNISITKNKMTIKLPPMPDYDSLTAETFGMKIPADLIDHSKAKELIVDGEITTGAVATATLGSATFTHKQITAGNETIKITLTGTEWDPTILTNTSKKNALLKGFTVTDQTKEWALLSKEISTNGQFELSDDQTVITITLPAVSGYSIIRDQVVNIKVPRTVVVNYKEDIPVAGQLKITVPASTTGDKSLDELTAEELAQAMADNKRLIVPGKKVEKIYVNTIEIDKGKSSITTIEVTAAADVNKVQVTVGKSLPKTVTRSGDAPFTFVYTNLEKNSELEIVVLDDDSKPLQSEIYKKIGKGSKTYNEIPKKNLAGSYLLYDILTHKSLLKDILKYYSIDELKVTS